VEGHSSRLEQVEVRTSELKDKIEIKGNVNLKRNVSEKELKRNVSETTEEL
jgi:hypothetical protein